MEAPRQDLYPLKHCSSERSRRHQVDDFADCQDFLSSDFQSLDSQNTTECLPRCLPCWYG